jgi:hypothetical protein
MKSSPDGTIRTFVTFRISGDQLIPSEITDILLLVPTKSYGKGQTYFSGKRAGTRIGKTGVWYFSTDKIVASARLADHLIFLIQALAPDSPKLVWRLRRLESIIKKRNLRAAVTLFWHGVAGAKHPSIPSQLLTVFKLMSIEIEKDFDTDETTKAA